ncbi:MAG TPA: hypothetical protein DCZ12_12030 [Gammaproteobacteria bacterium]|nr:hypothetical protein [Gammaproteobacteria bacterium]
MPLNKARHALRDKFDRKTWTKCSGCTGRGVIQPMLAGNPGYVCDVCNGVGHIPPDGEPLSKDEALRMMNGIIRDQSQWIRIYRAAEEKPATETGPDYYGQGGYQGD